MAADPQPVTQDNPEAYIARDRRRSLATGVPIPDRVHGAAIFADISGFTPLTEALAKELGPQRGAEELTANIGRVFQAVIDELDRFGGDVIYFSGDAITCWIDGDDGMRATACGLAMQDAMARVGTITTPGGATVQLAVKVAVAVGKARRFLVGDPDIQRIDVLAGRLIDDLADTEHHTDKGEVVLDPSAVAAVGDRVRMDVRTGEGDDARVFGVVRALTVGVPDAPAPEPPHPLPEEVVREWLLPAVFERLRTGRGEFLAELRPAYPVFVRFGGIDYDDDDEAVHKLDDFVRRAQQVMHSYGGNVLQLTLGDKGAYLYGVFGSPLAHEDDAARASAAVLALAALEGTTAATGIQIGVTYGQLRSGTYGHAMRRTFVCLGDAVNLSARLMSAAPPGSIYATQDVRDAAGDAFVWQQLPAMKVKGKVAEITPFALMGSAARASQRRVRFQLPLIGRASELGELEARLEAALGRHGSVVGIVSEAGMGKSRLVAEFVRNARAGGWFVAFGECEAFGTKTAYFVWQEVWRRLFGLDDEQGEAEQIRALGRRLATLDPRLVPRMPLLDVVLGLTIPDSELTKTFDAKLRKTSLEDLLTLCLRARAQEQPFVVVLEDAHWMDELSRDLLQTLARAAAELPVLFVVAYRPSSDPRSGLGLERLATFSEIVLDRLAPDEVGQIVQSKMNQLTGQEAAVSPELVELVAAKSEGNPFYVEELLNFLARQGIDPADPDAIERVELPGSLKSLVLSRIDAAPEEPRRTMKVAGVVGRTFHAPLLPGAYEELGTIDVVVDHLESLRVLDLVAPDREAEQEWIFKHGMTQEVAYESLPFAMRALLHGRIGEFIERTEPDDLERNVYLLEHHYWRSDRDAKKREYLSKAADAAAASYANNAAVAYLQRLVPLLEGRERVAALLRLGKALELAGDWTQAGETDETARALAVELGDSKAEADALAALAEVARKQGRYDDATARIGQAQALYERLEDNAGVGVVLHLSGTISAQRGRYDEARTRYLESMAIRERFDDKDQVGRLLSNLAIVAEYSGDFLESRRLNEQALAVRTELGDRWAIALSLNNLGVIDLYERRFAEASDRYRESVQLASEVGDPWLLALARFNLGKARAGLGDRPGAWEIFAKSLAAFVRLDDPYDLAEVIEDVAVLAAQDDAEVGLELLGASDRLRTDIGAARPAARELELAESLAAPRERAGAAADTAVERGRALDQRAAVARATDVCRAALAD